MKVNYHIDKFVDNNGIEREFIIAAVSLDIVKDDINPVGVVVFGDTSLFTSVAKVLCLGIAVRRPEDKFNEELGMRIAKGKALKVLENPDKGKLITVSDSGLVNTKMVQALLEQEAEYFKRDPRSYITGYGKPSLKK